jgi:hypothetical protein
VINNGKFVVIGNQVKNRKLNMDNLRGLGEVKLKKSELINKLKENRSVHTQTYSDAMDGYFVSAKKELEKKIKSLDAKKVVSSFSVSVPKDHTKEYDKIIEMLEMSTDEYIELSAREFDMYVRDEWISENEKSMLRTYALSSANAASYK